MTDRLAHLMARRQRQKAVAFIGTFVLTALAVLGMPRTRFGFLPDFHLPAWPAPVWLGQMTGSDLVLAGIVVLQAGAILVSALAFGRPPSGRLIHRW